MSEAARYPEELSHTVTATDGTQVFVRAIRPEDAERLMPSTTVSASTPSTSASSR